MTSNTKPADNYVSYWTIVWEQFRKNKVSYSAMWAIFGLFLLAVFAPVFASKMPFVWIDENGISFPWLRALLFNRNVFGSGVDLFFNLLLVLSPVYLAVRFVTKMKTKNMPGKEASALRTRMLGIQVIVTVILWAILVTVVDPRLALVDYRMLVQQGGDITALFPPLRIQYDDTLHGLSGPGIHHVLGKDNAGRDIFVRLLYGTRVSLSVGVIAVSIYITIGTTLGSLAGYFGGKIDMAIMRLIEIFLCFPSFFMILTFIGFLDQPSIAAMMVIIGLIGWTSSARLVRGEFLRLRNIDFVSAARAAGLSNRRIIFRHILPNAIGPVLVNATFGIAAAVLTESSLSFLGFGDPTLPSWGRILSFGRSTGSAQMMLIAGMAIFVTVSLFNLAGEGVRDALDPKLRK